MNRKNIIQTLVISLLVGVISFLGGTQYQKTKTPKFTAGQFQNRGEMPSGTQTRNGGNRGAEMFVNGEISGIDENTLTIKTRDGSSKIVVYSESTKINKTQEGLKEDLKTGEQALITGTQGADGIITAQNISIGKNLFLSN
jgi:hypothetical protein